MPTNANKSGDSFDHPLPQYPPTPPVLDRAQAKPMLRMMKQMMSRKLKSRLLGRGHKITTDDVPVKQKKIRYW